MYKKIKINCSTHANYSLGETITNYGKLIDNTFYGISYNHVTTVDQHEIFKIIPNKYKNKFLLNFMTINTSIRPHTDNNLTAVVNFYIKAGFGRTIFYDFNTTNPIRMKKYKIQTNGDIFDINDLVEVDSFVAKDGEAYILDITKPHGVEMPNGSNIRLAYALHTKTYSYADVCEMIKSTGYLEC
jgi:hypothetical protein